MTKNNQNPTLAHFVKVGFLVIWKKVIIFARKTSKKNYTHDLL